MFDTIFERILNALSFDIAIIGLHLKYATNRLSLFVMRFCETHAVFSCYSKHLLNFLHLHCPFL